MVSLRRVTSACGVFSFSEGDCRGRGPCMSSSTPWAVVLPLLWYCPTSEIAETPEDETMRQVIISPGEDGWWMAGYPSLPGCLSQGKTKDWWFTIIGNLTVEPYGQLSGRPERELRSLSGFSEGEPCFAARRRISSLPGGTTADNLRPVGEGRSGHFALPSHAIIQPACEVRRRVCVLSPVV